MTDPDYKIEECFEPRNMKVYFLVYSLKPTPNLIGPQFDTLEEAKECVRLCRKHSKRIFHYVEAEKEIEELIKQEYELYCIGKIIEQLESQIGE